MNDGNKESLNLELRGKITLVRTDGFPEHSDTTKVSRSLNTI